MALEIKTLRDAAPAAGLVADRRLFLTADESQMVEDGDPAGRFLLVGVGGTVPACEVARLGLRLDRAGCVTQAAAEPEPPAPEVKEQPKPDDKARAKPATKTVTKKKATKKKVTKRRKRSG